MSPWLHLSCTNPQNSLWLYNSPVSLCSLPSSLERLSWITFHTPQNVLILNMQFSALTVSPSLLQHSPHSHCKTFWTLPSGNPAWLSSHSALTVPIHVNPEMLTELRSEWNLVVLWYWWSHRLYAPWGSKIELCCTVGCTSVSLPR